MNLGALYTNGVDVVVINYKATYDYIFGDMIYYTNIVTMRRGKMYSPMFFDEYPTQVEVEVMFYD